MKQLLFLFTTLLIAFPVRTFAVDPTCDFPLLDEPLAEITSETCEKLAAEPYQRKFMDYVCSTDCKDLKQCLDNYDFLSKKKNIKENRVKVEKATKDYPHERRSHKCGNFEPNVPLDENDDIWGRYEKFVNARRVLNGYFREEVKKIKNVCIRKDNNKGTFMKFRRTLQYLDLLKKCDGIKKK